MSTKQSTCGHAGPAVRPAVSLDPNAADLASQVRAELPDVPHAADDVLYVCMLWGDALARQTIGSIMDDRIEEGKNTPEGYEDDDTKAWEEMRNSMRENAVPEYPIDEILQGKTRYHLLERSCITMGLTTLDAANVCIRNGVPCEGNVRRYIHSTVGGRGE